MVHELGDHDLWAIRHTTPVSSASARLNGSWLARSGCRLAGGWAGRAGVRRLRACGRCRSGLVPTSCDLALATGQSCVTDTPAIVLRAPGGGQLSGRPGPADLTFVITGVITELRDVFNSAFAERVAFFEAAAGERAAHIERNILVQSVVVSDDKAEAGRAVRRRAAYLRPDTILEVPTLLIGTVAEMVTALLQRRDRFGISSVFVHESTVPQFAPVVAALSGTRNSAIDLDPAGSTCLEV